MAGTTAAAALLSLCGAATSQTPSDPAPASNQYLNNQVQLGDVIAGQTLTVIDAEKGASAVTAAVGNAVDAEGVQAPLDFESRQTLKGAVLATTDASVGNAGPYLVTSTTATGNTATAGTCCATTSGYSVQNNTASGVVAASNVYLNGYAYTAAVDTSAVGNTQGWYVSNGALNTQTRQKSTAGISATSSANIGQSDEASYTATAVANDVEANTTNSPVDMNVVQSQENSPVQATVDATGGSAGDSVATASAVANNYNVYSDSYGDSIQANQTNKSDVSATSDQTLGSWYGTAASTAYGVANSNVVSNAGSYTGVDNSQNNSGAITVNAGLFSASGGGAGGDAYVSATGVGNATSAYACAVCNGTISARNRQVNSGSVHSTATASVLGVNTASGVSSAIGNTASYQVVSSGSD